MIADHLRIVEPRNSVVTPCYDIAEEKDRLVDSVPGQPSGFAGFADERRHSVAENHRNW